MSKSSNKSPQTSGSESDTRTISNDDDDQSWDLMVTEFFTKWNPKELSKRWKSRFDELTDLCKGFFNFLFDGTREEEESIYFTNKAMKKMILAYPEWSPWIPGDQCGLHRKFKDTVGAIYHVIHTIEKLKLDQGKLEEFNERVDSISKDYSDLNHMLSYGML